MKEISESGVSIEVEEKHANPSDAKTFYNPVMRICREFVLSAVAAYASGYAQSVPDGNTQPILCLDAFGATGIAGLQWKVHLPTAVQVYINDISTVAVQSIVKNCKRNNITVSKLHSNGLSKRNSQSDVTSKNQALSKSVEVINDDANVTMHRKQFHVINVDPFGGTVQYLDATFRNVYHGGVVLLTSTDVAALYGKCPAVTSRNYGAYTRRTDYTKEMAVRIVLAQAARAAAKCNKGFDVLYCVGVEHFVHVAVRIKRGANHGNKVTSQISRYLHCLMCTEWAELPNSNSPTEKPYSYLPCTCSKRTPGKTAVVVGPMWRGSILSEPFIKQMKEEATRLKLSDRATGLMALLLEESVCAATPQPCPADTPKCAPPADSEEPSQGETNTGVAKETDSAEDVAKAEDNVPIPQRLEGQGEIISDKETVGENEQTLSKGLESKNSTGRDVCDSIQGDHSGPAGPLAAAGRGDSNTTNGAESHDTTNVLDRSHTSQSSSSTCKSVLKATEAPVSTQTGKRGGEEIVIQEGPGSSKKARKVTRYYEQDEMPLFYYNLHKRQIKNVNLPRMEKLVATLQGEGFRASRTHFEAKAVRTSACLEELKEVLRKRYAVQKK